MHSSPPSTPQASGHSASPPDTAVLAHAQAPSPAALRHQVHRMSQQAQAPWLHQEVARRLADKLEAIKIEPAQWVDWSAWAGAGAPFVQQRYPQATRWVVEPHAALAHPSQQQLAQDAPRHWRTLWRKAVPPVFAEPVPDDAPWLPTGAQMLWANMTLHASTDLKALFAQWRRHLSVDGFLMCSGLGPDTAMELKAVYREMGWAAPTIDFIDMHDLGDELVQAGFADPVMDMERLLLTWESPEAMLAELRTWGGNVAQGRFAGCRTPKWRTRLIEAIAARMKRPDGRIAMTIELVYGHAIKPAPRATVQAETRVSLQDMKAMIRRESGRQ